MNSNNLDEAELNETSWQDSSKRTKSSTESDGIAGVVIPTILDDSKQKGTVPPLPTSDVHPNAAATHDFTIHYGSLPAPVDSPKHLSGNEEPSPSLP
jgi:hypothetical protein